jgi:predicted amidohydrolase YtcJ
MEPSAPRASVLACRGGELVYVGGDLSAAEELVSSRAARFDLEGRAVVPGLIDGHAHIIQEGLKLGAVDVRHKSREETLALIRREAERRPKGEWIIGHGWNQENWPGEAWPAKEELDLAAPDHYVALDRVDKHSMWVNSRVIRAVGLNEDSPDPTGGEILRNAAGGLQGILIGMAMWAVWNIIPQTGFEGRRQALLRGQAELLSWGLTSIMDAGTTLSNLELFKKAYQTGELKLRIRAMLLAGSKQDEEYLAAGGRLARSLFGERLSIDGVKIHSDGSLGSRSARLLEDYADRPGHRGGLTYDDEQLQAIMERARDYGLAVTIHAIGDGAARQAVDAMERVLRRRPADHRWRIEHFQVAADRDLNRALALGIVPSIQSVGLMSDLDIAEDRLGPETIKRSYRWRDILSRGGRLVNGSDCPVESVNPFEGMYAAVTRRNLEGRPTGGWRPEQKLSREEAFLSYTLWAAWAEFNEDRKGSLKAGKLADFAVLDRDPMTCPEDGLKDIKVAKTVLGGEIVYEAA